ncbi:hypothetical protein PV04_07460 [Phialophora macrospora]|uniref:BHLH domain-containing protein n=1 Tax=Phialophora macrospora TaxID=1851006 RepID=A0A0D2FZ66_9EURO|nr:hypothetical protein PV04_07460 [Phialophora macrospora]
MSYSQSQSQSQSYPNYQRTSYDNPQSVPQPGWNSVDDLGPSSSAAAAPFENYPQFPRDPGGYNDANLLPPTEQIAQSPNYSQYLNFDSMDAGPAAAAPGPGSAVMAQPMFGTPPVATGNPQQYGEFTIKTEPPETEPLQQQGANIALPAYSPSMNLNLNQRDSNSTLPRTCGDNPPCLHVIESPELEMEDLNLGEWYPQSTISPLEGDHQLPSRQSSQTTLRTGQPGADTSTRSNSSAATNTTKKPRKRGRKPSVDNDEEAQARAKQAHSIVERRYRDNLNGKIMQLQRTLSSIAANPNRAADYFLEGDEISQQQQQKQHSDQRTRIRKSDVMTDAVNYVHQSEVQMRHMENEISRLTERVRTLEKLVRCEDCVVLKEMVRRSLQAQAQAAQAAQAQAQVQAQAQAQAQVQAQAQAQAQVQAQAQAHAQAQGHGLALGHRQGHQG